MKKLSLTSLFKLFAAVLALLGTQSGEAASSKSAKSKKSTKKIEQVTKKKNDEKKKVEPVVEKAKAKTESKSDGIALFQASSFWPKVVDSHKIAYSKRKKLADQIYTVMAKSAVSPQEEAVVKAGLAVLYCHNPDTRYAAPALMREARQKWPSLVGYKETGKLWDAFVTCYSDRSTLDEFALEEIARSVDGFLPSPENATEFAFYRGRGLLREKKTTEAMKLFQEISLDSEHYRRAKFAEGLALIDSGKLEEAREALQVVVSLDMTRAEKRFDLSSAGVLRLRELAVLNIGRLLYEQGQFLESLAYYRSLTQESNYFYTSLYEQGWSFFMAGYPNRALGAEYAATTPFFENEFNPDSYFLSAVIYYWLCNFEESHKGVQKFIAHARGEGDELRNVSSRFNAMAPQESLRRYANIVEDHARGVSASNLGLGPKVIFTVSNKEDVKDGLVALQKLQKIRGRLQARSDLGGSLEMLLAATNSFEDFTRAELGRRVRDQVNVLALDFEKALTQSRLLYLEILTAKKDSLLGKARSVSGGEFLGFEQEFYESAHRNAHAWRQDKNEFWFDELGHYVFETRSQCQAPSTAKNGVKKK